MYKAPSFIILIAFLINTLGPYPCAQAQDIRLPVPGFMVQLSPAFNPPSLKGVTVYPDNPFKFDFILDKADGSPDLKQESVKLIKYFLASITTPENDLWVNLSPYEKNRIIPDSFGKTDMGRDLLAEDYILKQVTASLIYPEGKTGKKFWNRVYEEAAKRYGTTDIPVDTFNKVWIVPGHAKVYVHGNTAFVVQARLKVMLEQDYLSMSKHEDIGVIPSKAPGINRVGSDIVREIVIPQLEKEVNEGGNFASLRQVYSSLILAVWFKKYMKDSILGRKYMDQNKVTGIRRNAPEGGIEFIYQRYLKAFKKGVYNYIKEEQNPVTREMVPRKYFSGGWVGAFKAEDIDYAQTVKPSEIPNTDFADVAVNLARTRFSQPQGAWDYSKFASYKPLSRQEGTKIFIAGDGSGKFLKVYLQGYEGLGMAELKNTEFLNEKGVSGVPRVLNWGKMGDGGIGILMQGIGNAASMDKLFGTSSQRLARLTKAAEILEAAHQAGISHNDIKPQNIIVNDRGEVMVIDWGIANTIGESQKMGNGLYKAPEEIKVDQSDVYSLGVTIYDLFLSELLDKTPVQAALRVLYRRMTLRDYKLRPTMTVVAEQLGQLAQNAAVLDRSMVVSTINEERAKEILGELWPELIEMAHLNSGQLDDWIKQAVPKGEEVNGYGQNGIPEIIIRDGSAHSPHFEIYYKGILIADIKLAIKQGYGSLDVLYLNPVFRGNRWGTLFVLKAIRYFEGFGKDKVHIVISDYGRAFWHNKIKLVQTADDIYPMDTVQEKIKDYLRDNALLALNPEAVAAKLSRIQEELEGEYKGLERSYIPGQEPKFGTFISKGVHGGVFRDPDPSEPAFFYKEFFQKEKGILELKTLKALDGVEGIPQIKGWGLKRGLLGDLHIWVRLDGLENSKDITDPQLWAKFSLSQQIEIFHQIAKILESAHQAGISHNDIKPWNIIIDPQGRVKLIDWGNANALGQLEPGGDPNYRAPEKIKLDQSDVFSLGRTMLYSFPLLHSLPIGSLPETELEKKLNSLYERMTRIDPNERLSMNEVADELKDLAQLAMAQQLTTIQDFLNKRYEFKKQLPGNRPGFGAYINEGGQAQIFVDNTDPAKGIYKLFFKKRGMNELIVLSYLKGVPGVPKVLDWDVMRNENIWIRMEGISNASSIVVPIKENVPDENIYYRFSDIWNEFSFSQCLNILAKVAKILEDVHRMGISHNDVKPPNIIVNKNGEVMLIDWDSATLFNRRPEFRTLIFDAPEEFKQDQSDVYSLQVTIKLILEAYPEIIQDVEDDLNLLLEQMSIEDPNQRPSMEEVASELSWLALKASLNPAIHPLSEPDLIKRINAYFILTHADNAQLSSIPKYAYSPGPLHNVGDLRSIVDRLKSNTIKTAYYPGIGSDYKAAFDITDADTIIGVESDIWSLWAKSSAYWGATDIQAKQEYDAQGVKRAVIGFDYRGKKRNLILYNEDINVLNPQKIPEIKDGYDFLFLKGLPLSSYGHDFLAQSLSLLKENGLILENNLEKGLDRFGESTANFSVIKRKSIGAFINSYKYVVKDLSIWQKTALGGIDLTAKRMDLEVATDKSSANQPLDLKTLENIEINGLYIKDIEIKPLKNLPEMLGIPAV